MNSPSVKTILLVEDEALIAIAEAKMLTNHGFDVITAYNAQKAIETVREKAVDLILMDIDLGVGKMDGTEAAEIILKDKDIPVVFLSSHTEREVVEKTEGITSYGYIVKNSGETVLLASIKMAFRLFEANRQIREREEKLKHYIGLIEERNKHLIELYEKMDSPQEDLFDFVLDGSIAITNSSFGFSGFINDDESVMSIFKWSKDTMKPIEFPIEKAGIWGDCIRERKPVIINDYDSDVRPTKHGTPDGHVHIRRFLCVPVFDGDKIVAVGAVANKNIPYDIADADSLMMLYDKMWALLKQQRAEKALEEGEQKWRTLVENNPDFIAIHDAEGKFLYLNRYADGFSAEDVIGTSAYEYMPEESKKLFQQKEKECLETWKVQTFEHNAVGANGISSWYENYLVPFIEKGNEKRVFVVSRDITERKQLERELARSEAFYNNVLQFIPVFVLDHDFRYAEVNDNAAELVHMKAEDLVGKKITDLFPGFEETVYFKTYKRVMESKRTEILEADFVLPNGTTGCYQCTILPCPEGIQCVAVDITGLKKTEAALRYEYEKFKNVIEHANDGIVLTDENGNIAEWNKAQERITGLSRKDVVNRPLEEVQMESALPERKKTEMMKTFLKTGKAPWLDQRSETTMLHADGREIVIETTAFGIPTGEGYRLGSIVRDITRRKAEEEQLKTLLTERETLMKEMNHRVKNNLQMVSSLISLKEHDFSGKENLSDLKNQVDAIRLVHDQLNKTGQLHHIDFKTYAENILHPVFAFSPVPVDVTIETEIGYLHSRVAVPVGLIINETATNAVKYGFLTDEDHAFSVSAAIDAETDECILVISNTGKPFPKEIQLDNPITLGLQLITALVEQLRGTIELQRSPRPVFTIRFPVEERG